MLGRSSLLLSPRLWISLFLFRERCDGVSLGWFHFLGFLCELLRFDIYPPALICPFIPFPIIPFVPVHSLHRLKREPRIATLVSVFGAKSIQFAEIPVLSTSTVSSYLGCPTTYARCPMPKSLVPRYSASQDNPFPPFRQPKPKWT